MRYLNLLSIQLLLATLLNISVPSALYAQLSISTDPFIQKQIAREHWAPGGKHYPSSFMNRGAVISASGKSILFVLSTHHIGNYKLQNANIKGFYGFSIDISSPHGYQVHTPFNVEFFSDPKTFREDSNDGRQSSVKITSEGYFNHPPNAYDPPAGGGYPNPIGARDYVIFAIEGIATGVYPLSNSDIQKRDIAPPNNLFDSLINAFNTASEIREEQSKRTNLGFQQVTNARTGRERFNGILDTVLGAFGTVLYSTSGFVGSAVNPNTMDLQRVIDDLRTDIGNAHVYGFKHIDIEKQHFLLQTASYVVPIASDIISRITSDAASFLGENPEIEKIVEGGAMMTIVVGRAASKVGSAPKMGVPKNVSNKIPSSWGSKPNRKNVGTRWQDPNNRGNGVRIDKGNPNHSLSSQQVDHVIVRKDGKVIGRDGNPIQGSIKQNPEQAHIPLKEYQSWKTWDSP